LSHPEPKTAKADAHQVPPPAPAAAPSAPTEKRPGNNDPFAGLDSLEAEMAKLLGREKLN
jgi:hypothetical protein